MGPLTNTTRIRIPKDVGMVLAWEACHFWGSVKIPLIYGLDCTCFLFSLSCEQRQVYLELFWLMIGVCCMQLYMKLLENMSQWNSLSWITMKDCGNPSFLTSTETWHMAIQLGTLNPQLTMVISFSHPPKKGTQRRTLHALIIQWSYNDLVFCDQWSSACVKNTCFFSLRRLRQMHYPIGSLYGIIASIWLLFMVNVGKYVYIYLIYIYI